MDHQHLLSRSYRCLLHPMVRCISCLREVKYIEFGKQYMNVNFAVMGTCSTMPSKIVPNIQYDAQRFNANQLDTGKPNPLYGR